MPLWNLYCSEGAFSSEVKHALAEAITDVNALAGMPRFSSTSRSIPTSGTADWTGRSTSTKHRAICGQSRACGPPTKAPPKNNAGPARIDHPSR
jgi:hypothetical protein